MDANTTRSNAPTADDVGPTWFRFSAQLPPQTHLPLDRISYYDTPTHTYLVGTNTLSKDYRLLKFTKDDEKLDVHFSGVQDRAYMTSTVRMLKAGGTSVTCGKARAVLGLVRFTKGYYLILITKRAEVGKLGTHRIFEARKTLMISLCEQSSSLASQFLRRRTDEDYYRDQFQAFELNDYFYYSPTYDLSNTLQANMTYRGGGGGIGGDGSGPPMFGSIPKRSKFVWNEFLLEPTCVSGYRPQFGFGSTAHATSSSLPEYTCSLSKGIHVSDAWIPWVVFAIRGCVGQCTVETTATPVHIVLIGRTSKNFAGTRYLRRGVNEDGHVANHVEVEQIVLQDASLTDCATRGKFSSYVQVRGSVPVHWFHAMVQRPKPPILLGKVDPFYNSTRLHFEELLEDYGAPLVLMNLLKQSEKKRREAVLSNEYVRAFHVLTGQMDPESRRRDKLLLRYHAFDLRNAAERAWNSMASFAERDCDEVGIFACDYDSVRLQTGVVRSNCVDCIDRTNLAQFFFGIHMLGKQLTALGVLHHEVDLAQSQDSAYELMLRLYLKLGDAIAIQYGGSAQVGAGILHRGLGWDKLMGIRRLYNNLVVDKDRQLIMNLFLGYYEPCPNELRFGDRLGLPRHRKAIRLSYTAQAAAKSGERGEESTLVSPRSLALATPRTDSVTLRSVSMDIGGSSGPSAWDTASMAGVDDAATAFALRRVIDIHEIDADYYLHCNRGPSVGNGEHLNGWWIVPLDRYRARYEHVRNVTELSPRLSPYSSRYKKRRAAAVAAAAGPLLVSLAQRRGSDQSSSRATLTSPSAVLIAIDPPPAAVSTLATTTTTTTMHSSPHHGNIPAASIAAVDDAVHGGLASHSESFSRKDSASTLSSVPSGAGGAQPCAVLLHSDGGVVACQREGDWRRMARACWLVDRAGRAPDSDEEVEPDLLVDMSPAPVLQATCTRTTSACTGLWENFRLYPKGTASLHGFDSSNHSGTVLIRGRAAGGEGAAFYRDYATGRLIAAVLSHGGRLCATTLRCAEEGQRAAMKVVGGIDLSVGGAAADNAAATTVPPWIPEWQMSVSTTAKTDSLLAMAMGTGRRESTVKMTVVPDPLPDPEVDTAPYGTQKELVHNHSTFPDEVHHSLYQKQVDELRRSCDQQPKPENVAIVKLNALVRFGPPMEYSVEQVVEALVYLERDQVLPQTIELIRSEKLSGAKLLRFQHFDMFRQSTMIREFATLLKRVPVVDEALFETYLSGERIPDFSSLVSGGPAADEYLLHGSSEPQVMAQLTSWLSGGTGGSAITVKSTTHAASHHLGVAAAADLAAPHARDGGASNATTAPAVVVDALSATAGRLAFLDNTLNFLQSFVCDQLNHETAEGFLRYLVKRMCDPPEHVYDRCRLGGGVPRCDRLRYYDRAQSRTPNAVVAHHTFWANTLFHWLLTNSKSLGMNLHRVTSFDEGFHRAAEFFVWMLHAGLICRADLPNGHFGVDVTCVAVKDVFAERMNILYTIPALHPTLVLNATRPAPSASFAPFSSSKGTQPPATGQGKVRPGLVSTAILSRSAASHAASATATPGTYGSSAFVMVGGCGGITTATGGGASSAIAARGALESKRSLDAFLGRDVSMAPASPRGRVPLGDSSLSPQQQQQQRGDGGGAPLPLEAPHVGAASRASSPMAAPSLTIGSTAAVEFSVVAACCALSSLSMLDEQTPTSIAGSEAAFIHTTELAQLDLSLLDSDARRCVFVNIFNCLYIHAWIVALQNPTIDFRRFYTTYAYNVGGSYFTLHDLKHGMLRNNRPAPTDVLPPLDRRNADGDSRIALIPHDPRDPHEAKELRHKLLLGLMDVYLTPERLAELPTYNPKQFLDDCSSSVVNMSMVQPQVDEDGFELLDAPDDSSDDEGGGGGGDAGSPRAPGRGGSSAAVQNAAAATGATFLANLFRTNRQRTAQMPTHFCVSLHPKDYHDALSNVEAAFLQAIADSSQPQTSVNHGAPYPKLLQPLIGIEEVGRTAEEVVRFFARRRHRLRQGWHHIAGAAAAAAASGAGPGAAAAAAAAATSTSATSGGGGAPQGHKKQPR